MTTQKKIHVLGWLSLGSLLVLVSLSDFLARAPADTRDIGPALRPPAHDYPFGTDLLGRDMMSETLHGLGLTVSQSLIGAVIAIIFGGLAGLAAARLPRLIADPLRWALGVLASLPALLLAVLFIGLSSRGFSAIAVGLAIAPLGFVQAFDGARAQGKGVHAAIARATGLSRLSLLRRDLVTGFRQNLFSNAARALAKTAIILSTASFLGFGAVPPHRDLGLLIAAARTSYLSAWWTALFPALALLLFILCARLASGTEESPA